MQKSVDLKRGLVSLSPISDPLPQILTSHEVVIKKSIKTQTCVLGCPSKVQSVDFMLETEKNTHSTPNYVVIYHRVGKSDSVVIYHPLYHW